MYSELYLFDAMESQGDLYSEIVERGQDLIKFHYMYQNSKVKECFQRGMPYFVTMMYDCLYEESNAISIPKSEMVCSVWAAEWVGQFYELLHWHSGLNYKNVCKKYPIEDVLNSYGTLHDLDIEVAVERWLGKPIKYVWSVDIECK